MRGRWIGSSLGTACLTIVLTLFGGGAYIDAALQVPEPDTVVFGKIVQRAGVQQWVLTSGQLQWTLGRGDQAPVTFEVPLRSIAEGEFSYRMNLPHQVLASGVQAAAGIIPLGPTEVEYRSIEVSVNGYPARILNPEGLALNLSQQRRAFTHRVDLELTQPMPDSDEDGIPDWWEERFGLDQDNAGDAGDDLDGDGRINLDEYLRGTSPLTDNRVPSLLATELWVYPDAGTGLLLEVDDADSAPADLLFTLVQGPQAGQLQFRLGDGPDAETQTMAAGTTFRGSDLEQGRVIYMHPGASAEGVSLAFAFTLQDETHPPQEFQVRLQPVEALVDLTTATATDSLSILDQLAGSISPASTAIAHARQLNRLIAGQWGLTIWDGADRIQPMTLAFPVAEEAPMVPLPPGTESTLGRLIVGSAADDSLAGGPHDDVIAGGPGGDTLIGGRGADRFFWRLDDAGRDRLPDFEPAAGDVIDLSLCLAGESPDLADYIRLTSFEGGTLMAIDSAGGGGGDGDIELLLPSIALDWDGLYAWVQAGTLLSGTAELTPRVTLSLVQATASENGPRDAVVEVSRTGSLGADLEVALALGGSAMNGIDYMELGEKVRIPAGSDRVLIEIVPYADQASEPTETVQVRLLEADGYVIHGASMVIAEILDLLPEVTLEVLEPVGVRQSGAPAAVLLRRSGALGQDLLVRWTIVGTAKPGIDYESISSYVHWGVGESSKVLEFRPLPGADDVAPVYLRLELVPDPGIIVNGPTNATLFVISRPMTFAAWMEQHLPAGGTDPNAFSKLAFGELGISNFEAYAFGADRVGPDAVTLPRIELVEGRLTALFRRPMEITDLQYIVEVSTDLRVWRSDPSAVEACALEPYSADPEIQVFRAVQSTAQADQLFMRVRVRPVP